MKHPTISRRYFMMGTAAAMGGAALAAAPARTISPNEKLNIAGIGIGGMGGGDLDNLKSENIVALCDVDDAHAAHTFEKFPNAKRFRDYRVMFDQMGKDIDAVAIATPDHQHAIISLAAIQLSKHVFCQKPLTHSIYEARMVAKAAREAKVATQMGNQGQAGDEPRVLAELIWSGAIGTVKEIYGWSNRNPKICARGMARPTNTSDIPPTLDWNLWLGPAPERPYVASVYQPFVWRGWWDFGTGVLGDIGCHNFSGIFKALKLGPPTSVEASSTHTQDPPEITNESSPIASVVRWEFPAIEDCPQIGHRPAVTMYWYDGGIKPWRPAELEEGQKFGVDDGMMYVGDKGKMLNHRVIPEARMKEIGKPPEVLKRSPGHYVEWINACKGGEPAGSNFDFAGPLTEAVLLGNIAIRTQKKLLWDSENMKITNVPEANAYINPPYRQGWSLGA